MRPLILIFLAVAMLASPAAAQMGGSLELRLTVPAMPIKPVVETPAFSAEVTVPCDALLARVSPSAPQEEVPVVMTFIAQAGIVVTGPAAIPVDPFACVAGSAASVTAQGVYQISVPRTAPGLEAAPAVAKATLAPASAGQAMEATAPFTVTPDAYLVSQAEAPSKLGRCEDGKARFQVTVTNLGNVRTLYTFEVDGPGGGWRLPTPEAIVLDSPLRGGGGTSSATVDLLVECPFGNEKGAYHVVIRPTADGDPAKAGDPLTVNLLARSRAVPSPGPALLVLGLAAAALLSRRRA